MEKSTKAQASQIFVYVLGVVIMGMIVMFAFKGIQSIMKTSETADIEQFKNDFRNIIDEMSAYGRGRVQTIDTPSKFEKLCLIDHKNPNSGTLPPIVATSVGAQASARDPTKVNNVYLLSGGDDVVESFKADPIGMAQGASECHSINLGYIKLQLEGKTRFTKITVVQETE